MGALSDDAVWRLSVAYIGPKSRTERPRKTKIGTEIAQSHVTRTPLSRLKAQSQGHQAALFTAALTRQAAIAVSVGTYWPWEPTATLQSTLCRRGGLGGARRFGAHNRRRGAGHIVAAACLQLVIEAVHLKTVQWQSSGSIPSCPAVLFAVYTDCKLRHCPSYATACYITNADEQIEYVILVDHRALPLLTLIACITNCL